MSLSSILPEVSVIPRPFQLGVCAIALTVTLASPAFTQDPQSINPAAVVAKYRAARLATMEDTASSGSVDVVLRMLTDSAVYEHPQAGARIVGREDIGAGIRAFLGATRRPRIEVRSEIVTGAAVAAEEQVSFEVKDAGGAWVTRSRNQLSVYQVQGNRIARELQYWAPSASPDAPADSLVSLEKQSWVAWKGRDGAFFQSFLSDDHKEVGFGGITGKATVVAGVSSPACVVHSYAVDHFETTRLTPTTALLTYHASQQTECGGHPVPSPVWVSSLYVLRGGRWLNAVYQQTQTSK